MPEEIGYCVCQVKNGNKSRLFVESTDNLWRVNAKTGATHQWTKQELQKNLRKANKETVRTKAEGKNGPVFTSVVVVRVFDTMALSKAYLDGSGAKSKFNRIRILKELAYTPNQVVIRHRKKQAKNVRRMVPKNDENRKPKGTKKWLKKARSMSMELGEKEIIDAIDFESHQTTLKYDFTNNDDNGNVQESLIRQLSPPLPVASPSCEFNHGPIDSASCTSTKETLKETSSTEIEKINEKNAFSNDDDNEQVLESLIRQLSSPLPMASPSFEFNDGRIDSANCNSTKETVKETSSTEIEKINEKNDFSNDDDTEKVQELLIRQLSSPLPMASPSFEFNDDPIDSGNCNSTKETSSTEIEKKNDFPNDDDKKKVNASAHESLSSHDSSNDKKSEKIIYKKRNLPKVIANVQTKFDIGRFLKQSKKKLFTDNDFASTPITSTPKIIVNDETMHPDFQECTETDQSLVRSDSGQSTSCIKRANIRATCNKAPKSKVFNSRSKPQMKKKVRGNDNRQMSILVKKLMEKVGKEFAKLKTMQWRTVRSITQCMNRANERENDIIGDEVGTNRSPNIMDVINEKTDGEGKIEVEEGLMVYKVPFIKASEETCISYRINRAIESLWPEQERLKLSVGKRRGNNCIALQEEGVNKVIAVCNIANQINKLDEWAKTSRQRVREMISTKLKNDRSNKNRIDKKEALRKARRRRGRLYVQSSDDSDSEVIERTSNKDSEPIAGISGLSKRDSEPIASTSGLSTGQRNPKCSTSDNEDSD